MRLTTQPSIPAVPGPETGIVSRFSAEGGAEPVGDLVHEPDEHGVEVAERGPGQRGQHLWRDGRRPGAEEKTLRGVERGGHGEKSGT